MKIAHQLLEKSIKKSIVKFYTNLTHKELSQFFVS